MQDELRREMTKSYYVGIALAAINIVATVVCIFLMPSEVPMSLDGSNVVDRTGSSLENLIWPLVACGTCLVNRVVIKGESKEDAKSIGNATMGIEFLLLVAAGLTYLFLLTYNPAANTAAFVVSPVRLALMASGIALVLLMNTLPVLLIELGSHLGSFRRPWTRRRGKSFVDVSALRLSSLDGLSWRAAFLTTSTSCSVRTVYPL